ncbi:hypothetical protein BDZ91DRAFT_830449 [Kalaharituber pfeilii]|nr:hypothetical protein BDZ91DRAFT_830449 [Kalaharituber pfeilii]
MSSLVLFCCCNACGAPRFSPQSRLPDIARLAIKYTEQVIQIISRCRLSGIGTLSLYRIISGLTTIPNGVLSKTHVCR